MTSTPDPSAARPTDAPDEIAGAAASPPSTAGQPDLRAEADRLIRELQAGLDAEQAVYAVAVLANRSAAELHRLAKAQATATRGTPSWGGWAALQNAARKLVLDATAARDSAARLTERSG